jgi:hypothetical protein
MVLGSVAGGIVNGGALLLVIVAIAALVRFGMFIYLCVNVRAIRRNTAITAEALTAQRMYPPHEPDVSA